MTMAAAAVSSSPRLIDDAGNSQVIIALVYLTTQLWPPRHPCCRVIMNMQMSQNGMEHKQ